MRRLALLTAVAVLVLPGVALAGSDEVIKDCTDNGTIDKKHSNRDYDKAIKDLPADIEEYSDCRKVIADASRQDADRGSGGGGGGGGDATGGGRSSSGDNSPANPEESGKIAEAQGDGGPVNIGGQPLTPGATALETSGASSLPTPLIAVIALLGLGALAGGVLAGREWLAPALRRVLRRGA